MTNTEVRDKLAFVEANKGNKKSEYSCPREVSNPGIWFGFVAGFDAAVKHLSSLCEHGIEKREFCDDCFLAEIKEEEYTKVYGEEKNEN